MRRENPIATFSTKEIKEYKQLLSSNQFDPIPFIIAEIIKEDVDMEDFVETLDLFKGVYNIA